MIVTRGLGSPGGLLVSFGLGRGLIGNPIVFASIKFTLYIMRQVGFNLER